MAENNSAIKKVEDMIKLLENIQPGEGLLSSLTDLKARVDTVQEDTDTLKEDVGSYRDAVKQFVTWQGLEDALKAHQRPKTPPPLDHPSVEALEALQKVGALADDFESFSKRIDALEVSLNMFLHAMVHLYIYILMETIYMYMYMHVCMFVCLQSQLSGKLDAGLEGMLPMILEMQSKLAFIESKHHIHARSH